MIEPAGPASGERRTDSVPIPGSSEIHATQSRRRLLQTLTMGGALMLAGCGQSKSNTPTGSPKGSVSGQTLRIPIQGNNPAKTSFYRLAPDSTYATFVKEQPSGLLADFVWEPGGWLDAFWAQGEVQFNWIDNITKTPEEITISIRDDARWSDGHQITGRDIAVTVIDFHINRLLRPFYASDHKQEPILIITAFDDFEVTDQTVTYRSSSGHFDQFWDSAVGLYLGSSTSPVPTHIAPYNDYADAVIETVHRAQQGEIEPWGSEPLKQDSAPTSDSLKRKYLDKPKYVEKFSKPENVLASGAWDLVELRGSEAFVFEKNPHHLNADIINFDTAILEFTSSAQRERAALKGNRLDYGSAVTPQTVVDSFPANITQLLIPGGEKTGNGLGLNFDHPALGNRAVRMALMYALDHSTIANNIHPSATKPVTTPGGDCWDATDYVSQWWIDENLTTYATNRDKAATLMRKAGYTRESGQWINPDGGPLTLTLATDSGTPRWEPSVASQMSEFGIQTSVKTISGEAFSNRVEKGEFPIWAGGGTSTSTAAATLRFWFNVNKKDQKNGIYPDEQFETGRFSSKGNAIPRTEGRYEAFTIKAPPVGEPNGPLTKYHPSALALAFFTNPPGDVFRRRIKRSMWLANWFLPTIPINKTLKQHFIDDAHWQWPKDTQSWTNFTSGGPRTMGGILASGTLRANPDNPESEGAGSD